MKDLLVAQRYAQALFEIARELEQDEAIEAELESISLALQQAPEIEKFFSNPALKTEQKRKLLQHIYLEMTGLSMAPTDVPRSRDCGQESNSQAYNILLNFFSILFEKTRFYLIHEIAFYFKKIADEAQGQGVADICSAFALKPDAEKQIVNRLEKIAGYKITVKSVVDPSLIGGVVVKVRNKIFDDSVKNKIHLIRTELTKIQSI